MNVIIVGRMFVSLPVNVMEHWFFVLLLAVRNIMLAVRKVKNELFIGKLFNKNMIF